MVGEDSRDSRRRTHHGGTWLIKAHYFPQTDYEPFGRAARVRFPRSLLHSYRTDDVQLLCRRELIQEGATGGLVIFEDRPNHWDAWDVEIHHLEEPTQLEFAQVSVVSQGPLRASVRTEVHSVWAEPD
jgi:hypothetical protein